MSMVASGLADGHCIKCGHELWAWDAALGRWLCVCEVPEQACVCQDQPVEHFDLLATAMLKAFEAPAEVYKLHHDPRRCEGSVKGPCAACATALANQAERGA